MADPLEKAFQEDDDTAAFRSAVQKGLNSLDRERHIKYEDVRRWLLSWGTDNELPPPE